MTNPKASDLQKADKPARHTRPEGLLIALQCYFKDHGKGIVQYILKVKSVSRMAPIYFRKCSRGHAPENECDHALQGCRKLSRRPSANANGAIVTGDACCETNAPEVYLYP
jgi:hypothetical protein